MLVYRYHYVCFYRHTPYLSECGVLSFMLYGSRYNLLLNKRKEPHTFGIRTIAPEAQSKSNTKLNVALKNIFIFYNCDCNI